MITLDKPQLYLKLSGGRKKKSQILKNYSSQSDCSKHTVKKKQHRETGREEIRGEERASVCDVQSFPFLEMIKRSSSGIGGTTGTFWATSSEPNCLCFNIYSLCGLYCFSRKWVEFYDSLYHSLVFTLSHELGGEEIPVVPTRSHLPTSENDGPELITSHRFLTPVASSADARGPACSQTNLLLTQSHQWTTHQPF